VVLDEATRQVLADLTKHGQESVIAHGGKGGRGNIKFASPNNPAPEIAENGEEGDERWVILELKLLADVGLVGFPSVGKSSLLSVVSAAKPKIAEYHFTTLSPNLGVVDVGDGRSFVMADLPGLIEGAHTGAGLGHDFLRHVERTRVILHLIDMAGSEGRDPFEDFLKINDELLNYNSRLLECPQIIVANKMDVDEANQNLQLFSEQIKETEFDYPVLPISTVTKEGVQELLYKAMDALAEAEASTPVEATVDDAERVVIRMESAQRSGNAVFEISRENEVFVIQSEAIEKLIKRTNFRTEQSIMRFAHILRKMGVDAALRQRGAKDGDLVRIADFEFEFVEHQ
jgi:GTP-binding protein